MKPSHSLLIYYLKHVLSHIYVEIIKFDLSNYQMFSWLSGVVQGMVIACLRDFSLVLAE